MPVGKVSSPWAGRVAEAPFQGSSSFCVRWHQGKLAALLTHRDAPYRPVFAQFFSQAIPGFLPETLFCCPSEVLPSTNFPPGGLLSWTNRLQSSKAKYPNDFLLYHCQGYIFLRMAHCRYLHQSARATNSMARHTGFVPVSAHTRCMD